MMTELSVDQQLHGYRKGHQLLASSITLSRVDQDLVDRLSDLSGPLQAGQIFEPYLTTYPLPSEEYYVVARTWQDKEAPRAGCVLTRSLIVRSQDWLSLSPIATLVELLVPFERTRTEVGVAIADSATWNVPPVTEPRQFELVEAIFLEKRQPVVVFEMSCAEHVVIRLLSALWPGIRRRFASCTFALAARSLGGRPFDLLFSPKSSRNRFVDWPGRKLEMGDIRGPRHRWTEIAAQQIFFASPPTLAQFDTLGILGADSRGDESALRLSLLWNDLVEKSGSSATAALGLLDILNSQEVTHEVPDLKPTLIRAINLSEASSTPFEHFRFLATLLGKFVNRRPPPSILLRLLKSASLVATNHRKDVAEFLKWSDDRIPILPRILCAGIADGFDLSRAEDRSCFSSLKPFLRQRLVSSSGSLAGSFAAISLQADPSWRSVAAASIEYPGFCLKDRVRTRMLPHITSPEQAPLLTMLLKDVSWMTLARSVRYIADATSFEVPEFDSSVLTAAANAHARVQLRDLLSTLPESSGSDRLLSRISELRLSDVLWLRETFPDQNRQQRILVGMLAEIDDISLERAVQDKTLAADVLQVLTDGSAPSRRELARVLLFMGRRSKDQFDLCIQILDQLDDTILRGRLAKVIAFDLFNTAHFGGRAYALDRLRQLADLVSTADVIAAACNPEVTAQQLNANICLLNDVGEPLRRRVTSQIDLLSEQIIDFRRSHLVDASAVAWSALISEAGHLDTQAQLRAAQIVLPFALRMTNGPASPLIIATFPVVHHELGLEQPAPGLLSLFFFPDWDRCNTARRQLVDSFMNSDWPPSDLLVAADRAGVVSKVIELIAAKRGGKKYLQRIVRDLDRQPSQLRARFQSILKVSAQ